MLTAAMVIGQTSEPKGADRSGASRRGSAGRVSVLFDGIRPYDRSWLSRDIVAGVTLAALAIPEVMGYTKIARTPVITGHHGQKISSLKL